MRRKKKPLTLFDEIRKKCRNECVICGWGRGLRIHQVTPIKWGGTDAKNNWIVLCLKCKAEIDRIEAWGIKNLRKIMFRKTVEYVTSEDHIYRPKWHKIVYGCGFQAKNRRVRIGFEG